MTTVGMRIVWFALLVALVLPVRAATAGESGPVSGAVEDELGGGIAGAIVTVVDAGGKTVATATTDASGAFALAVLPPGTYSVLTKSDLFETTQVSLVVGTDDSPKLRIKLKIAGLTDSLVVTGRRVETRLSETPQQIQMVTREDIERSVGVDVTDVLKKNSGVDVIQYPGLLSGVGMRGFNPEFSGINKRSLLLIDGRPSGVTNLASLLLENVDHVEVLKGPASAVYGASAMGGVINVITKSSRGPITGTARLGYQSFSTTDLGVNVGGSLSSRIDFNVSANAFNQRDDYHVGNGVDKRPGYELEPNGVYQYSSYRNNDMWVRVGADLSRTWRVDGRVNFYQARDVQNPGDVFFDSARLSNKDFDRSTSDVRLQGQMGKHVLSSTFYVAGEDNHSTTVKSTTPADQPYVPFLSSESFLDWKGFQAQDSWAWLKSNNLVLGFDSELVTSKSKRYANTGDRIGPFSADSTKRTFGVYAENTLRLNEGSTVVSLGGRVDSIRTEALDTPYKTGFTPSATTFTVFNPSVGIKQRIVENFRGHATLGRAFVPPDAAALTGYNTSIVGGRTQITQGNPDLRPEHSLSFDVGVERSSTSNRFDVTYFQTKVSDRVVSNIVISNPPPPDPVVLSYVNALGANMRGLELDFEHRLNRRISFSAGWTHFFEKREQLPTTGERDINVVADNSVRAGVDMDYGPVSGRFSVRHVQGRKDLDFNTAGTPQIDYEDFTVADLSAAYHLTRQHSVLLTINNLFDRYYYEKLGFPHPGRAFAIKYQLGFGGQ